MRLQNALLGLSHHFSPNLLFFLLLEVRETSGHQGGWWAVLSPPNQGNWFEKVVEPCGDPMCVFVMISHHRLCSSLEKQGSHRV